MKKLLKNTCVILTCIIGLTNIGYSQSVYTIKATEDIAMKLSGTSSLHDWEMEAQSTSGEAQFIFNPDNQSDLVAIKSLSFDLKVEDLKGDKSGLNSNAYEALKSDEYKEICYKLTSSTLSPEKGGYLIKSIGNLTIAGVTKEIAMDVHGIVNVDGTITASGLYNLNMTDYNVIPPSFMWGAMKTGDAVTLNFIIIYKKEKGV